MLALGELEAVLMETCIFQKGGIGKVLHRFKASWPCGQREYLSQTPALKGMLCILLTGVLTAVAFSPEIVSKGRKLERLAAFWEMWESMETRVVHFRFQKSTLLEWSCKVEQGQVERGQNFMVWPTGSLAGYG